MSRTISHARNAGARISAVILLAGLAVMPGCLEEDEVSPALKEASSILEALGAPGSGVPGDDFREREYREAINILRPIASSGSDAQNAAAALMMSRAEFGLAEPKLKVVTDIDAQLYALVSALRAEYTEWSSLNSLAETAEAFDPAPEQADINTKIQEREQAITEAQQSAEAVKARVAELEAQAKEASDQAAALRVREQEVRNQTATLSARDALPLHEEAATLRREADAFEVTAETFLSQAETIRPEIIDQDLEVERLTQQRDLLVASAQEVAAKAVEGRDVAADLREQATQTATRINNLVQQLESMRTGEAQSAIDEAKSSLETAASSAGRARSADRSGSQLATGEIQQAMGTTLAAHASTLRHAATILDQIANARAPLPTQSTISSVQNSFAGAADTTEAEALEAFIAARDAFDGSSVRGEASDRIDTVKAEIAQTIESLGGPSAEPEQEVPADIDEPAVENAGDEAAAEDGGE
ncbi:MAG: hypothetical protein ED559_03185 [Phycisphaera sp.]|nr:MAG: hypothetical protein ED559_03185 [Phycisphaera sp.]